MLLLMQDGKWRLGNFYDGLCIPANGPCSEHKKGPGESPGPIELTSGLVRGENQPTRKTFISVLLMALFLSVSAVAKAAFDHLSLAAGSFGAAASPDAA